MKTLQKILILTSTALLLGMAFHATLAQAQEVTNPEGPPELFPSGSEGVRRNSEIDAGKTIKLEVLFVNFKGEKTPQTNVNVLWKSITSDGEMNRAFARHGVTVEVNLNKSWKTMPNPVTYYFPTNDEDQTKNAPGYWRWQDYTNDSIKLLGDGENYKPNTIVVVIPDKGATGYKSVASGAHGASFRGIRRIITLVPNVYNEHYTTLMHEIGHCFGSGDLYPRAKEPVPGNPSKFAYMHEVGPYDMMGDLAIFLHALD